MMFKTKRAPKPAKPEALPKPVEPKNERQYGYATSPGYFMNEENN